MLCLITRSWVQLCQARLCLLPWPRHGSMRARRATAAQTHIPFWFQLFPCGERQRGSQPRAEAVIPSKALVHTVNGPGTAGAVCHQSPSGIDSEGNRCKSFQHEAEIARQTGAEFLRRSKAGSIDPKFDCKPCRDWSIQRDAVALLARIQRLKTLSRLGGQGRDRPEIRIQGRGQLFLRHPRAERPRPLRLPTEVEAPVTAAQRPS